MVIATASGPSMPSSPGRGPEPVTLGRALVRCTGRADGDMLAMAGADEQVAARRRAVVDRPWTVLRQVHGCRVVQVTQPGLTPADDGAEGADGADGAVSAAPGVALAVLTADCAPVALASPEGVIGVAHAGWRGLLAGVIPEAVAAMRALGATRVLAGLGPCIHPDCYRFGVGQLDQLAAALGDGVRSRTADGGPALDLPAAVRASLEAVGAELVFDAGICTACAGGYWSWRANRDHERQATVVWLP